MGVKADDEIEADLIFVLTPFHEQYEALFEVIQEVCTDAGFRCMRGDEKQVSGEILPHILQQIVKARLVIANISGRNPNVFYELGIAHTIGKSVLLVLEASDDIPFDISRLRVLIYAEGDYKGLEKSLRNWLIHTFAQIQPANRAHL